MSGLFKANSMADLYAAEARRTLSEQFWHTWSLVKEHQASTWKFGVALHKLFVQIGIRAQASSVVNSASVPQQLPSDVQEIDPGILALSRKQVSDFPKHLQVGETFHVLQWLHSVIEPQQEVSWVSYHQMLVDYQMFTKRQGPFTNGRKWVARGIDATYSYPQQVQWFGRFLQNLSKAIQSPLQTDQRRPSSMIFDVLVRLHPDCSSCSTPSCSGRFLQAAGEALAHQTGCSRHGGLATGD